MNQIFICYCSWWEDDDEQFEIEKIFQYEDDAIDFATQAELSDREKEYILVPYEIN